LFENPFRAPGKWYRANLHAHTTNSDGDLSPEECVEFYRAAGYHVLAITDHWCVSAPKGKRDGLLVIPGVEVDGGKSAQGTGFHIVGLALRMRGKIDRSHKRSAQQLVDMIRGDGGEAFIAHPYWSGLMAPDMAGLRGCFAVEVYNTGCDLEILRGFSMSHWDDLLTLGHDLGGVAVDDGHHHTVDYGLGWTMIRATSLTAKAVMEALRRGRYYSSTGPRIKDLQVTNGRVHVVTSRVKSIAVVSAPGLGARRRAPEGKAITRANLPVPESRYARYCRIEVTDHQGGTAWSNPILLRA
jgi:hypothetical protein